MQTVTAHGGCPDYHAGNGCARAGDYDWGEVLSDLSFNSGELGALGTSDAWERAGHATREPSSAKHDDQQGGIRGVRQASRSSTR